MVLFKDVSFMKNMSTNKYYICIARMAYNKIEINKNKVFILSKFLCIYF